MRALDTNRPAVPSPAALGKGPWTGVSSLTCLQGRVPPIIGADSMVGAMFGRETLAAVCGISACTLLATSGFGASPSFSCAKASQPVEHLICGDGELSKLDADLEVVFHQALERAATGRSQLVGAQRIWLGGRQEGCRVASPLPSGTELSVAQKCMADLYRRRIAYLSSYQGSTGSANLCSGLAEEISALIPPYESENFWSDITSRLDKIPNGTLRLAEARLYSRDEALDQFGKVLNTSPDFMNEIRNHLRWHSDIYFQTSGNIRAAFSQGGTLVCRHFLFYTVSENNKAERAPDPVPGAAYDASSFCGATTWADMAEIGGAPVFIGESTPRDEVKIDVVPWVEDRWQRGCKVNLRFSANIKVVERFCNEIDCDKISGQAIEIAKTYMEDVGILWQQFREFSEKHKYVGASEKGSSFAKYQLPTFGDTAFYGYFFSDVALPIILDGASYVGRVGLAGGGEISDNHLLFAAYKLTDGGFEPVAGMHIVRGLGNLESVSVGDSTWK